MQETDHKQEQNYQGIIPDTHRRSTAAETHSHVLPDFAREENSMEALWICIQSSLPSKRDSTRESTEMTNDKDYHSRQRTSKR